MNVSRRWIVSIGSLVFASALAVTYQHHYHRSQFTKSWQLQQDLAALQVGWQRLQLEKSTWSTYPHIERIASEELDMYVPNFDERVLVSR